MSGDTCDTSVLVPALVEGHPEHEAAHAAMSSVTALPAHVLLETYSVLTRLPPPLRIGAAEAATAVGALRHHVADLPAERVRALVADCARHGITGGAVYDALVAGTAIHHGLRLLTRDRRARATYDGLGTRYALL